MIKIKPSSVQIGIILLFLVVLLFPSQAFSSHFNSQKINSTEIADKIANSPLGKDITKNTSVHCQNQILESRCSLMN